MTKQQWVPESGQSWGSNGWVTGFKVRQFLGAGTAVEVNGTPAGGGYWTREEAEAVATALNAGKEVPGVRFASYSND